MQTKVITYSNPLLLAENKNLQTHLQSLHICATNSLRKGVKAKYQGNNEVITAPILSAGLLFSKILGFWSSSQQKMEQFTRLTRIIRNQELEYGNGMVRAFRNNQLEVLQTMRMLAEVGVIPGGFDTETKEERFFQKIWTEMETMDSTFSRIRKSLQNTSSFEKRFWEAVRESQLATDRSSNPREPDDKKEIVLHGFYFITPLQHRIFSLLQSSGLRLVFLNLYDVRYPKTFTSVDAYLGKWLPKKDWHIEHKIYDESNWGDTFSLAYEEDRAVKIPIGPKPEVIAFDDFQSFLKHLSNNIEEEVYLSPNHEKFNERLKDYYPEAFNDRHFLSYPIGQYLLHLHGMWDEQRNELVLTEKGLFECFSSGWLFAEDKHARNYTEVLKDILPYFSGCTTISEWRAQSRLLKDAKLHAVEAFQNSDSRFHQMMENPFLRFSFFKRTAMDVSLIIAFIEKLIAQAEQLFRSGSVAIHEHFEKIESMLHEGIQEGAFLEAEHSLVRELQKRLSVDSLNDEKYYVEDLAQAVSLYLGGMLKGDFEDDDPETEITAKFSKILSFENADRAPYLEPSDAIIHLCGLDEESLPYPAQALPWPLSRSAIESTNKPELEMIFIREDNASAIARYLYYNVLAFAPAVRLSWIREFNGKSLQESIYIMLLGLEPDSKNQIFTEQDLLPETVVFKRNMLEAKEMMLHYPADAAAEYALCPRRFYYSFLVQSYASYDEDFHHQFLFGSLVKAGLSLSESTEEEVFTQVSALFPQWSAVRRRYIFDESLEKKGAFSKALERFDGKDYVRGRKLFQLLLTSYPLGDDDLMKPANEVFKSGNKAILEQAQEQVELMMEAKPTKLCRFCPHLKICNEGWYSADDKMRSYE